jgi:hypothetical protein
LATSPDPVFREFPVKFTQYSEPSLQSAKPKRIIADIAFTKGIAKVPDGAGGIEDGRGLLKQRPLLP